jgi:pimeloyl-ACP methyl ester carboxylesterase
MSAFTSVFVVGGREIEYRDAILEVDTRDLAPHCGQPILCVQFDDDKVVAKAHGEEIERHAPNATMVTLPGNHLGMFTSASALAEAVAHFVLTQGRHARPAFQTSVRDVTAVSGLSEKTPSMPRQ